MWYLFLTTTVVVENHEFLDLWGWYINKSDLILQIIIPGVAGLLTFIFRKTIVKIIKKIIPMAHNPQQPVELQKNSNGANALSSDVKTPEDEEIYLLISDILFDYLDSLDDSYFIRWMDGYDKKEELAPVYCNGVALGQQKSSDLIPTDKLLEMIERVNSCDRLEIKFPPYKEDFFKDALTKLREYRKEYTPLLLSMNSGIDLSGLEVADVFKEIRKLHSEKYDDMVASVHDCLKKFKQRQI